MEPKQEVKYRYRLEDRTYSTVIDPDAECFSSELKVDLAKFKVIKETPKGAWVECPPFDGKRFVLNGSGKRLCHETIELALESFIARKQRAVLILKARLRDAEEAIKIAQKHYGTPPAQDAGDI